MSKFWKVVFAIEETFDVAPTTVTDPLVSGTRTIACPVPFPGKLALVPLVSRVWAIVCELLERDETGNDP